MIIQFYITTQLETTEINALLVGYTIKIENLPISSGEKTDMLIGFSMLDLATNFVLQSLLYENSSDIEFEQ